MLPLKKPVTGSQTANNAGKGGKSQPAANAAGIKNKSHSSGSSKEPGRVVFFVMEHSSGTYRVRIGQKVFLLKTDQKLALSRFFTGTILRQNGSMLVMEKGIKPLTSSDSLTQLFREYPHRVITMLIRNSMPVNREDLEKLAGYLMLIENDGSDDDILLDLYKKNIVPDKVLPYLRQQSDSENRHGQQKKNEQEQDSTDLAGLVKKAVLRHSGGETPLLLYNHLCDGSDSHWVHIPFRFMTQEKSVSGHIRMKFSLFSCALEKAVVTLADTGNEKNVFIIDVNRDGYTLEGDIPGSLLHKRLSSGKEIVDIINRNLASFTGLGFHDHETEPGGIDFDA